MLGALGGVTLVAMVLSYRLDRRLVPFEWAVAAGGMLAYTGGFL